MKMLIMAVLNKQNSSSNTDFLNRLQKTKTVMMFTSVLSSWISYLQWSRTYGSFKGIFMNVTEMTVIFQNSTKDIKSQTNDLHSQL